MRRLSKLLPCLIAALLAAGCSTTTAEQPDTEPLAFASDAEIRTRLTEPDIMSFPGPRRGLAGRTLRVGSVEDIVLMRKEVILTFDDGPIPDKTRAILDALDRHDIKATFLMVGQMAQSYPAEAREVARRGHTIGSHTQNHPNLTGMSFERATEEIRRGERSIEAALGPSANRAAPFFRFPYLATTPALRQHLAARGVVVIDVDVDSKDYFVSSPEQVRARTLAALERRGSGIILFHDLHARTVAMLPRFLADLDARGYKVVRLVPKSGPPLVN